ncbi:hypothetical protein EYC84_009660 [Monilinia fructicola]|uniref:Uncharacterized protein n=1 Tax=Monilinia fructicola TaxID=38448 RepID=A0A5M9JB66_MONFR|nr:hypothetical protein EYC84_009660 [Monilinia fructicola]
MPINVPPYMQRKTGVTKYASPWTSPVRNSVSHNALDTRARSNRPVPPFNLTTQSVIDESVTGAHGNSSANHVENPRGISADTQGLDLLANVFAETPQKYLNSEKQSGVLQGHQRNHNSAIEQITESESLNRNDLGAIFASEDRDEPARPPNPAAVRQHTSEDLAVVFCFGRTTCTNPKTSIVFASNDPRASAAKRITKPASAPSLTHEDLGDVFASDKPQASTPSQTKQNSSIRPHTSADLGGIFASNSPIKRNQGTVTPTYMNGDDVDDNKSIGSWTRRAENRASTSTQSG